MLLAHPRPEEIRPLWTALGQELPLETTRDGRTAATLAAALRPRLVIVALDLPGLSGLEVIRRLPQACTGDRPPIVAVGAAGDPRLAIAVTYGLVDMALPLPQPSGRLVSAVWRLLDGAKEREIARLAPGPRLLIERTRASFDLMLAAVARGGPLPPGELERAGGEVAAAATHPGGGVLVTALEALRGHHAHTYIHSLRVAANLARFGLAAGMGAADVGLLAQAGLAHDLGKTVVSADVLNKPSALDEHEWRLLRRHPEAGAASLRATPGVADTVVRVAARHHERLDGQGYPAGLRGAALDEVSLLAAIADVHAALTEPRAYKRALPDAEALATMRGMVGSHFEPGIFAEYERAVRETEAG